METQRTHFSARTHRGIVSVPVEQAIYFKADHKYVMLRHEGGELLIDESLAALEREFGAALVRINRNALVPRERMGRIERQHRDWCDWWMYPRGAHEGLRVSRRHVPAVRRLIAETEETES